MAIKDILVHVDTQPGSEDRIAFAADLARKNKAHLTGLHVKAEVVIPMTENDVIVPDSLIEDQERVIELQAQAAKNRFDSAIGANEIDGEWRVGRGLAADVLRHHAHSADLIIVGQQHPDSTEANDVPEGVLQDTGCPTLIMPYAGVGRTFARNVMVAWDDSAPAARAVHDSLALIAEAKRVEIVAVQDKESEADADPCAEILEHLHRHGVNAQSVILRKNGAKVADMLLGHAADTGCDLLVMGSYGHARWREYIFGGVTEDMLEKTTIPIFTSH
jgi:nucleotide-binding universal stress UspA family protein